MKQKRQPQENIPWYQRQVVYIAALVLVASLAYSNSFSGAFVFDDVGHIAEDETVHHLGELGPLLKHSGTRPLLGLTLAMNYAQGGLDVTGYHAFNLVVHLLAGLTLFGIARRTFLLPRLKDTFATVADPLAFAIAMLWLVHPLTTQAVTYTVQRCESMMSLAFLLMLYCVLRGATGTHARRWYAAALVMLLLGLGSKEVMVTASFVILLYDRVFLATSWRELIAQRKWLYAASGLLVVVFMFAMKSSLVATDGQQTLGFGQEDLGAIEYARSQPGVILHYLRLAFWPDRLCLDYEWPVATNPGEIYPPLFALLAIGGVCIWALKKQPAASFLIMAFFAILAPTSSIVPIKDLAFEHRMYLPLAALIAGVVSGGYWYWLKARQKGWIPTSSSNWGFTAVIALLVVGLSVRTWLRNEDYRTEETMWRSVLAVRPANARATHNLAIKLVSEGRESEAISLVEQAIKARRDQQQPDVELQMMLGEILTREGKLDEAISKLTDALAAVAQAPWSEAKRQRVEAECLLSLGTAYEFQENFNEAGNRYRQAAKLSPDSAQAQAMLGQVLIRQEDLTGGLAAWEKAVALRPDWFELHHDLARLQFSLGNASQARLHLQAAQRLRPDDPEVEAELAQLATIEASFASTKHEPDPANDPHDEPPLPRRP